MTADLVSIGNAELPVSVWGDRGPAILALHPGVGDRRIWRFCAPAWAEAGFRAHCPSLDQPASLNTVVLEFLSSISFS